jgi:hypothetical protein
MTNACNIFVGKPGSKHRCNNNIKMDIDEVGCMGMDMINLVQDAVLSRAFVGMRAS